MDHNQTPRVSHDTGEDVATLLTSYQHVEEGLLKVMESPIKLISRRSTSALEKR
jgi:hypothetical protein